MNIKARGHHALLRPPEASDAAALHRLIQSCPPLDGNSVYCNLLQCTHFAATAVVAASRDGLLGAVTGYLVPGREDTLFVWQVAVAEQARGQALGRRMLNHILARPHCAAVTHLETTVTEANSASWAMFEGFARQWRCELSRSSLFDRTAHFHGRHESEILARIGPLSDVLLRQARHDMTDHPEEQTA